MTCEHSRRSREDSVRNNDFDAHLLLWRAAFYYSLKELSDYTNISMKSLRAHMISDNVCDMTTRTIVLKIKQLLCNCAGCECGNECLPTCRSMV